MKTKAKTHRLLLNTTPEGRLRIQELTLQSGADSESALLRQAFEFYALLHPRLAAGDEAFMRTPDGSRGVGLDISAVWDGPDSSTEDGVRQRMELKLDPSQREQLDRLVGQGAAPTLTALAGVALEAYSYYLRYRNDGMLLYLRTGKGTESLVVLPVAAESARSAALPPFADDVKYIDGFCDLPNGRTVYEALEEEAELHSQGATRIVIDTPNPSYLTPVADKVAEAVWSNLRNGVPYIYVVDSEEDKKTLVQWVNDKIAPGLRWEDLSQSTRTKVERVFQQAGTNWNQQQKELAMSSPAWCLIRAGMFRSGTTDESQTDPSSTLAVRMFNTPRWYAEMSDGRLWGYYFSSRVPIDPLSTQVHPMGWKQTRQCFADFDQFCQKQLLAPEPIAKAASNILRFQAAS